MGSDSPAPASPATTAPRPETLTLDSPVIGKAADPYLSVRTANALANTGKRTVGAVLAMSEDELVRVRDLGPVGRAQVDQLRTAIDGPLCPITATIDATTRRCGNARGHSGDCWFPSDPDAACDACDDTDRLDGIEWFGCMTGDCPHETQAECDAAILAFVREVVDERAASRIGAAPTPEAHCVLCGFTASANRAGANPNGCCGACGLAIPASTPEARAPEPQRVEKVKVDDA